MDTSATSQYKANGEPYQDAPGGRRLVFADVELRDGIWKVVFAGCPGHRVMYWVARLLATLGTAAGLALAGLDRRTCRRSGAR